MAKDAVFTMKIEPELRDKFMEEAERLDRSASQVVREMMREFVSKQEEERVYDKWFRAELEEAIRESDDPNAETFSHEQVMAETRAIIEERIRAAKSARDD